MSNEQLFHDGAYKLELIHHEMRMSHWVNAPVLSETESGERLLDLSESVWDLVSAQEAWTATGSQPAIRLKLARYPDGAHEYEVEIQPQGRQAILGGVMYPLEDLLEALESSATKQRGAS